MTDDRVPLLADVIEEYIEAKIMYQKSLDDIHLYARDHWLKVCKDKKAQLQMALALCTAGPTRVSTYTHVSNDDCRKVQSGEWTRCMGHKGEYKDD